MYIYCIMYNHNFKLWLCSTFQLFPTMQCILEMNIVLHLWKRRLYWIYFYAAVCSSLSLVTRLGDQLVLSLRGKVRPTGKLEEKTLAIFLSKKNFTILEEFNLGKTRHTIMTSINDDFLEQRRHWSSKI